MTTDKNSSTLTDNPQDHLETIAGIGQKTAEALSHIGIHCFADLAQSTPAELAKALFKQVGLRVSPERIEAMNWIGQAQALLQQARDEQVAPPEKLEAERKPAETQSVESTPHGTQWQQHAGFSLFFDYGLDDEGKQSWQTRVWQTRIYHDETGEEVQFPGIEPHPWVNWILDQAGLPVSTRSLSQASDAPFDIVADAKSAIEAQAKAVSPLNETRIEIKEVQISEIGPSIGVPEKQLQAQVHFKISGFEAEKLVADNLPCRLEVHTVNTENGMSAMVTSERVELKLQVFEYTSRQHFPLPKVGRYRLYCLALVLPPGNLVAYHEGPIITIVP